METFLAKTFQIPFCSSLSASAEERPEHLFAALFHTILLYIYNTNFHALTSHRSSCVLVVLWVTTIVDDMHTIWQVKTM